MSKWLKEPLFHFLLLGVLIFLVYDQLAEDGRSPGEIVITAGQQENLVNTFARTWQRPPTPEEFSRLLDDYVRQEIAYREGQSLGLDQNDIVIRRRLRQKLELLAEDVASLAEPSEQQLQDYLDDNPELFRIEPRLTFRQIYLSPDKRGASVETEALELLQRIRSGGPVDGSELAGDSFALPATLEDVRLGEVERTFGAQFADKLETLETGQWAGPVVSGFGLHLVLVEERQEGRVPDLDEVRNAVQREWFASRRQQAVDSLYDRLAEDYDITVQPLASAAKTADS